MTSKNLLDQETSPYLLQHKDNPVHWMPWGTEALDKAKEIDKPILLSIGYAACHWCHVMAHESFENPEIAALMNEHFINIKVDREERPDVDAIYQAALAATGQAGGWPLTMFLTPEGKPFWGGTYFPATANYGRAGFPEVVIGVSHSYHADKEKILENVKDLHKALENLVAPQPKNSSVLTLSSLDQAAEKALGYVDTVNGGTQGSPKFPQPTFFEVLWRAFKRTGISGYQRVVTHTMTRVCQGGIYDHLGGGFARYSTDHEWLAPHFEKMLYDNALLIGLLTSLWRQTNDPLFAKRIEETITWASRDLWHDDSENRGGFYSSFDADSDGEEGLFYIWDESEIDKILGDESSDFKRAYNVRQQGNWEGKNILHRSLTAELGDEDWENKLTASREKLFAEREKRNHPSRDDKILADWNGMMISSLAEAGAAFDRPEWIEKSENAFSFIVENLTGPEGRLFHSWCDGHAQHPAVLEDYAAMSDAALTLFEFTGNETYLVQVVKWMSILDSQYLDSKNGGYFMTAEDTPHLIARSKPTADNAVPSGNGILLRVLAKMFHLTGDASYKEKAEGILKAVVADTPEHLIHQGAILNGFEVLASPVNIAVIAEIEDERAKELINEITHWDIPNRIIYFSPPQNNLPSTHPAAGKTQLNKKPTVYICPGNTCGLPITEKERLKEALSTL
ncbi:MAG: thioredoxin domain-containing protein [Rhodospirillales bacterium]|nr:thioredoxin domain-containing protein [Rhodospirillales bacterium]